MDISFIRILFSIKKDLDFSITIDSVTGFPLECLAVNCWYNMSSLTNLGSFSVLLEKFLHLVMMP